MKLRLSPSATDRWSKCPASARHKSLLDLKSPANYYSDEGTRAHWGAGNYLAKYLKCENIIGDGGELPESDYDFTDKADEMVEHAKSYCETVQFLIDLYEIKTVHIEAEYNATFKTNDPDFENAIIRGYVDCVLIGDGVKIIIDYKYGKGVYVNAYENSQLLTYLKLSGESDKNLLVIVQPRIDKTTSWMLTGDDATIRLAELDDQIEFATTNTACEKTGTHCRWCPAINVCGTVRKDVESTGMEISNPKDDFSPVMVDLMTPEQLAGVIDKADAIREFLKAVENEAHAKLMSGEKIPDYELVQNFGNRKWIDDKAVIKKFGKKYDLFNLKLKSPAQLEKLIGKGVADSLIIKEEKTPALAHVDDKRETYNNLSKAIEDFK